MLEARRRAYLKAMGVVQYTPVNAISGAHESPMLLPEQVYPQLAEEPEVDNGAVPPSAGGSAIDVAGRGSINGSGAVTSNNAVIPNAHIEPPNVTSPSIAAPSVATPGIATPNIVSPDSAPTNSVESQSSFEDPPPTPDIRITPLDESPSPTEPVVQEVEKNVRFALTMVEIPGKLLVLADLGDAGAMGCSAVEYQLLQAVLKSLGLDAEPSQHLFRWPLINNKRMAQGKAEAAEGLQGFLMAKVEKLHVPNLLLMGEYASGFMPEQEVHIRMDLSGSSVQCFRTPSLQSMLTDWRYKPQAWAALANLKSLVNQ